MSEQAKILKAIAENLGLSAADLDRYANLSEDLNLGPVEISDLIQHLSDEFEVHFALEDIEEVSTVEDLIVLVEDSLI